MVHVHNYFYGTDDAIVTITADKLDDAYDILCRIVKNPEKFKLFDWDTVEVDVEESDFDHR